MKHFIRSLGDVVPKRIARAVTEQHQTEFEQTHDARNALSQQVQKQLVLEYSRFRAANQNPYTDIRDAGFRQYSQFEEDGIILFLLTMIGFGPRKVVELCAGDGTECMATNLVLNHGFEGFLFDGDEGNVGRGRRFFQRRKDSFLIPPTFEQSWITKDNVNELLKNVGASGEVDLFSLDIDGNDYWVWQAIEEIRPRLCVFETHDIIPSHLSLTIAYDPAFSYLSKPPAERDHRGVSLLAMTKLARARGYRLIGAHKHGFNAFFLRNDLGAELFPEVSVERVHDNPWTRRGQAERWPLVSQLQWVEV
jgi:hypothetical protein